jgi:Ca2+-binding EF-hand superfamily protein
LNRPGSDEDIKRAFDQIDVDGTGLVEWNEFSFSLMGEKALNFGALADLEILDNLLQETEEVMKGLRDALFESKASNADRAERNKDMRERLTRMKGDMNSSLNSVIGKVMSVMGQDARDLMTDEQISKVLIATFKKFDTDGSGGLEYPEFQAAFESLGLVASPAELQDAFKKVDTDGSGVVDQTEFVIAVKDSRMAELSLNVIVQQMDGSLDGLENIFADYKRKLEASTTQSGIDMKMSEEKFRAFQAAARKRRILKRQNEEKVQEMVRNLGKQLSSMTGTKMVENHEEYEAYNTIKDTFQAFDRDGNAELGWSEYLEAWRFLNQPGTDEDVKRAFDAVDVNGSGLVEFDEFVFSIMGEKSLKYG